MPRFILDKRILIRGCEAHKKAGLGCAADYKANYIPIYSPTDISVTSTFWGNKGGNWIEFLFTGNYAKGYKARIAHLSDENTGRKGEYKKGDLIAKSGNTGSMTTGPHVHNEIYDPSGNRVPPEKFWDDLLNNNYANMYEGQTIITPETSAEEGKWYLVRGGKKYWIPDDMTGWSHGLLVSDVNFISKEAVQAIPDGGQLEYWDGHLVRLTDEMFERKSHIKK